MKVGNGVIIDDGIDDELVAFFQQNAIQLNYSGSSSCGHAVEVYCGGKYLGSWDKKDLGLSDKTWYEENQ